MQSWTIKKVLVRILSRFEPHFQKLHAKQVKIWVRSVDAKKDETHLHGFDLLDQETLRSLQLHFFQD